MEHSNESLTGKAIQMVSSFFADQNVHTAKAFIQYTIANGPDGMKDTHAKAALYRSKNAGILQTEGRGLYRLYSGGGTGQSNMDKLRRHIQKASAALEWTVNVFSLDEQELDAIREVRQIRKQVDMLQERLKKYDEAATTEAATGAALRPDGVARIWKI